VRLWLLSNGRGEDRAAALIASELWERRPGLELSSAPLVTSGEEFSARGVPTPITGSTPPSGGFPIADLRTLLRDLPAIRDHFSYARQLRRLVRPGDEFLAVGDVFLTGLARLAFRGNGIHVALAKSLHGRRHSRVEHHLLRRWTWLVFTRDEATAADLRRHGVRAVFVGNPLVDSLAVRASSAVRPPKTSGPTADDACTVLLLPGSRVEAPANLVKLLDVALRVGEPSAWTCAWPAGIPIESGVQAAVAAGWTAAGGHLSRGNRTVALVAGEFESMVASADLVVGLAGSANEQAAALGKPVVTFVGCGPQTTAGRMQEQERLLGGAARFVRGGSEESAAVVSELLRSPGERHRLGCLGIARLGPPGGAARIADRVIGELGL
jgi:uncharacterized protein (TIGR03492 family)